MQKEQFFEDQPILVSDLSLAQSSKEDAIKQRQRDLLDPGIIVGSQMAGESAALKITQGPNPGLFITVNTGVAVSPTAERIVIPSVVAYNSANPSTTSDNGIGGTTLTPQSSGSQNVPVVDNAVNWVWIGYLETTDTTVFTISESSHARLFVKHDDGYLIQVTQTSANPDSSVYVLAAQVTTASGAVTLINTTNFLQPATLSTTVPSSPYSLSLPVLANLPPDLDRPASIPSIPGFTYVTTTPDSLQFSVNFTTGVVQFNAADSSAAVTISYQVLNVCVQNSITTGDTVGAQLHLNQPTTSYAVGSEITLTSHVNAVGTGTVTPNNPHGTSASDIGLAGVGELGAVLADSGIVTITGFAGSTSSSLSPNAVSAFALLSNLVTIAPLVSGEFVNIGGTVVSSVNIPATLTFNFVDPITALALPAGTYYFYVDPVLLAVKKSMTLPGNAFPVASIVWNGSNLILPITDMRKFGTLGKNNMRLELLLALAAGAATDNRTSTLYDAKLTGTATVTNPTYAYIALGGTTLNILSDTVPVSLTFAPAGNITIFSAVNQINNAITLAGANAIAIATSGNQIKLLSPISLKIVSGTSLTILGFTALEADSGNVKEMRISNSTSSTGVMGTQVSAEIDFTYDISGNLIQSVAYMGNSTLTTILTYNSDNSLKTIQEIVA